MRIFIFHRKGLLPTGLPRLAIKGCPLQDDRYSCSCRSETMDAACLSPAGIFLVNIPASDCANQTSDAAYLHLTFKCCTNQMHYTQSDITRAPFGKGPCFRQTVWLRVNILGAIFKRIFLRIGQNFTYFSQTNWNFDYYIFCYFLFFFMVNEGHN